MLKQFKYCAALAVLTAFVLLLFLSFSGFYGETALAEDVSASKELDKDYYYENFTYLGDKDCVFDSVTYEELAVLLQQEGNFLILFGGVWCPNTTPVIGYINEVAKEYGVDTIYNFDFRLDATKSASHIRETNGTSLSSHAAAAYNYMYGELITKYLTNADDYSEYKIGTKDSLIYTNAQGQETEVPKIQVPFLFLYNKSNVAAPIVSGLELMTEASDFVTPDGETDTQAVAEYKGILRKSVFDNIPKSGLTSFNDGDYFRAVINGKSSDSALITGNCNLRALTYHELNWLLGRKGEALLFLGGTETATERETLAAVNARAVESNVLVYVFDFRWDGGYPQRFWGYEKTLDIREESAFAKQYVDVVSKNFSSLVSDEKVSYSTWSSVENSLADVSAPKLSYVFLAYANEGSPAILASTQSGDCKSVFNALFSADRSLSASKDYIKRIVAAVVIVIVVAGVLTTVLLSDKRKKKSLNHSRNIGE